MDTDGYIYDICIPIDITVDGLLDDINDIHGFCVGVMGFSPIE